MSAGLLYHRTIPDCGRGCEARQDGQAEKHETDAEGNKEEVGRDTGNGEGPAARQGQDRESRGQDVEEATREQAKTPGTGQRERHAARRALVNRQRVQ
jgi:hypothetical protein